MKKVIVYESGNTQTITGNDKWLELDYKKPEWSEDDEAYFIFKGNEYFLSEFMRTSEHSEEYKMGIVGIHGTSYFSGIGIKLPDGGDAVKAYNIRS